MELEIILTELRPFELSHLRDFVHNRVGSLCNQLLLQFSMNSFETLHTSCGHNENMRVGL